ncbi:Pantothenate kinase 1 [Bienertia sinuspersici]
MHVVLVKVIRCLQRTGRKESRIEAEIEQLRGDNTVMQAKLEFLIAENQRKRRQPENRRKL